MVEVGKTYNCFDDGKIKESRRHTVTITEIIPFDEIDFETLAQWSSEVKDCYWLYAEETDFFIRGVVKIGDIKTIEDTFVRTKDGGWFSIDSFWASQLDVDGSLTKQLVS